MARAKNATDADIKPRQLFNHGCDVAGCKARAPIAHTRLDADAAAIGAGWMLGGRMFGMVPLALCPDHAAIAIDRFDFREGTS